MMQTLFVCVIVDDDHGVYARRRLKESSGN